MNEDIVINIDFEGLFDGYQSSIQVIPANIAWEDFELMLKVFAGKEDIRIFYVDEENDVIIISCKEELEGAFKVAKNSKNTLRLKIKGGSIPTEQEEKEVKQIHTDVDNQAVSMKMTKGKIPVTHEVVPIAMETGEQISAATTDPSCDKLVTKETGEKLVAGETELHKSSQPKSPKAFFFIKHKQSGLVLDVKGWKQQPGTPVVLWLQKDRRVERIGNQLWYTDDATSTIRSKFCNMCLTAGTTDQQLTIMPCDKGSPSQMWVISGETIRNSCVQELTLVPRSPSVGASIRLAELANPSEAALWVIEYRDMPRPVRKTNKETGETQIGAVPKAQKKSADPYSRLSSTLRRNPSLTDCIPPMKHADGARPPPKWFTDYMENFKRELVDQSCNRIAQKTVNRVLRGLEGAVITSVREVNEHVTTADHVTAASGAKQKTFVAHAETGTYSHSGIICDRCEKTIVGVRYKCGNCEDYDLCERCEAVKDVHHDDHIFLKIRRPLFTAGRKADGRLVPLLARNLYKQEADMIKRFQSETFGSVPPRAEAPVTHPRHSSKDPVEKLKRKQEKLRKKGEKIKVKEEKLKRRIEEEKELPQKKEKLELPQYQVPDRMDAEFLRDDTIPDGTHVQPGTKFVKRWVLKNTGVSPWTQGTLLQMIFGNMAPVESEVEVPYVAPGDEGTVAVSLVAPDEPGVFQSHWRLSYCGVRFGHRIWCSIVVDPKEVLDPKVKSSDIELKMVDSADLAEEKATEEKTTEVEENQEYVEDDETKPLLDNDTHQTQEGGSAEAESGEKPEVLTREDLLSFEMLEITEREVEKKSQTATPNNTPFESRDVTPPATPASVLPPAQNLDNDATPLSRCSSVEVVSEPGHDLQEGSEVTAELVQQRMASLGLGSYKDADIESLSTCSEGEDSSEDDSDNDFFIVPIPDFFNPDLPALRTSSTSLYVNKEKSPVEVETKTRGENSSEESQPLLAASADFEYKPLEAANQEEEIFELANENEGEGDESDDDNEAEGVSDENVTPKEPITERELKEVNAPSQNDDVEGAAAIVTESQDVHVVDPLDNTCRPRDPKEVATTIVSHAFDIATKGATQVYHTAKDVFHTLQARNAYEPPKCDWSPPAQDWSPPNINWTPPRQDYEPPVEDAPIELQPWNPPETAPNEPQENSDPMAVLIEMGFADRALNRRLLDKNGNDVERAIQELLQIADNNWHANRH